jgi:hypothetical protein
MIVVYPYETQQHIVRGWVLRVVLEHGPLEVLHGVGLAVHFRHLPDSLGNGQPVPAKAIVLNPIIQE